MSYLPLQSYRSHSPESRARESYMSNHQNIPCKMLNNIQYSTNALFHTPILFFHLCVFAHSALKMNLALL